MREVTGAWMRVGILPRDSEATNRWRNAVIGVKQSRCGYSADDQLALVNGNASYTSNNLNEYTNVGGVGYGSDGNGKLMVGNGLYFDHKFFL